MHLRRISALYIEKYHIDKKMSLSQIVLSEYGEDFFNWGHSQTNVWAQRK